MVVVCHVLIRNIAVKYKLISFIFSVSREI